jgi:hypothetical protein
VLRQLTSQWIGRLRAAHSGAAHRRVRAHLKRFALLAFGCLASGSAVADITSYSLSEDEKQLLYRMGPQEKTDAPLQKDQVGYSQVQISGDRKHIGWVATFQTCCASYPVPLKLIVASEDGSSVTLEGTQGIFKWCFVAERSAVAFRQEPLHGATTETYTLAETKSGRTLETYLALPAETESPSAANELPKWASCASEQ